jgi:hypothetical protein
MTEPSAAVQAIIADDGSSQPTAGRHVEHGDYDTTSLTPSTYARAVHRDWIGHWSRWGWASRQLPKKGRVLEPGCGPESMFFRHLTSDASLVPALYVGVDLNAIKAHDKREAEVVAGKKRTYPWAQFKPEFDFVTRIDELVEEYGYASFDRVVSFEVYEHIAPALGLRYLDACRDMLHPDGELLFSTPVFKGKKAANHVREYTVEEMQLIFADRGFEVVGRYGTFASYHDVKRGIKEEFPEAQAEIILDIYERCREFYGDGLLAAMLAPVVPDHSRNCTWRLRRV